MLWVVIGNVRQIGPIVLDLPERRSHDEANKQTLSNAHAKRLMLKLEEGPWRSLMLQFFNVIQDS